uniref:(northern house mosquito) hypothetical protein n=1 Tax=Culex pipiens TaxID=7175 RepID=A0A8D8ICP3_CULPI
MFCSALTFPRRLADTRDCSFSNRQAKHQMNSLSKHEPFFFCGTTSASQEFLLFYYFALQQTTSRGFFCYFFPRRGLFSSWPTKTTHSTMATLPKYGTFTRLGNFSAAYEPGFTQH